MNDIEPRLPKALTRGLRAWADRPPRISAAGARARVTRRLPPQRAPRRSTLWAAALVLTAAAAALIVRAPWPAEPAPVPDLAPPGAAIIVFELGSGTHLYFTPANRLRAGLS